MNAMNLAAEKHEGTDVVRMPRRMDAAAADALRSELRDLAGVEAGACCWTCRR